MVAADHRPAFLHRAVATPRRALRDCKAGGEMTRWWDLPPERALWSAEQLNVQAIILELMATQRARAVRARRGRARRTMRQRAWRCWQAACAYRAMAATKAAT
jgi:hypothetical protein